MTTEVWLCKDCHCCPRVLLGDQEVRIGEEGNEVKLTREQWNLLVAKVQSGEIPAL